MWDKDYNVGHQCIKVIFNDLKKKKKLAYNITMICYLVDSNKNMYLI